MVVGLGICTFTSSLGRCDVLPSSMSISLVLQSVDVFFPPVIRNKMHRKKSTLTREGEKEKENHELKNEICTRDIQDKKLLRKYAYVRRCMNKPFCDRQSRCLRSRCKIEGQKKIISGMKKVREGGRSTARKTGIGSVLRYFDR